MRAVICTGYGPPEVLQIKEVPKPIPKEDELLINIRATAINSGDVRIRGLKGNRFLRLIIRLIFGFTKPRRPILGTVFSGVVAQVGNKVSKFNVGDEVFGMAGMKFGTYAEYLVMNQNGKVILMPENASFEEAAAIPFGGQTAIYFLKKAGIAKKLNPEILIIGATGSVGTAAIQIAKHYKADITVVCSSKGTDLVKSLGVSKVILYDKEDFTEHTSKFDIVFDAVGKTSKKQCKKLLKKDGVYSTVGGMDVASETIPQLELLKELFEKGAYDATIDKVYPMDKVVDAHRYVDTERKKGNVVLKISD
ncbi:NAD(P)-dependent alcohol dehydrogenase [Maribacter sp. CXY002]|uniref:NAD(P)-dependent alcohol dehydrogenase n=1 Tax=Maribacter luteocoastalis TaxID=3407671 RepID=UPI003B674449